MGWNDRLDIENRFFFHTIEGQLVCVDCLNDKGLIRHVYEQVAPNAETCSYCEKVGHTIQVEDLQNYMMNFFPYARCVDELPWVDGEYFGNNHDENETLEMFVGTAVCDELYQDFYDNLIQEQYCQSNWASLTPTEQWVYQWREYREVIQPDGTGFKLVLNKSDEDRNHDEPHPAGFHNAISTALLRADALSVLPAGNEIHRVRFGHHEQSFKELTAPPAEVAAINRFSPKGVSLFYGSIDLDTAGLEIKAKADDPITHGIFRTTKDLALIDFTAAQFPDGDFDPSWVTDYHISSFLKGFLKDIRKEVKGEGSDKDYIPTQALCHFFRTDGAEHLSMVNMSDPAPIPAMQLINKTQRIDGICFRSSKGTDRTCYVLFYDNETSADILELEETSHSTFVPKPDVKEFLF
jgi:hypothetical protein